ncbi:MAG: MFS transporter [Dehalococcoidia bacterium]
MTDLDQITAPPDTRDPKPETRPPRLPALAFAGFRIFALGAAISFAASFMFMLAASWQVYLLAKPPLNKAVMLGLLGFSRTVPMLCFVLVAGVTSDRLGRRRLMLITNSLSAAVAAGFALFALAGWLNVWFVLAAAFLMGSCTAFNQPSQQAIVHDLVGVLYLHNGVALMAFIQNLVRIGAPLVAGAMLTLGHGSIVPAMVAVGYAIMAAALFSLHLPHASVERVNMLSSLRQVFGYIRSERLVMALLLLETIPGLFELPYQSLLPIFAGSIYHRGAAGLGIMQSASGIGAFTGSLALVGLSGFRRKGLLLIGAITALGASLLAFGLVHIWLIALAALVLVGMFDALYIYTINGLLLSRAPDHLRGRVMSVFTLADSGMSPLGSILVGLVAGILGAPAALALSGATIMTCVLGVAARVPRLRRV